MNIPYFILIDTRDSEKFRRFKTSEFNKDVIKILNKNNVQFIWSLHKGQIKDNIWNKITKNDFVYFSIPPSNFKIAGHISKKLIDKKLGKIMWPDSTNAEQITHFLLFDELEPITILHHKMISNAKSKLKIPIPGIYEIKQEFQDILLSQTLAKFSHMAKPKEFSPFKIPEKSPDKNKYEVNRFIRDSVLVKKLKKLYGNRCQICGFTFEYAKGKFYSEVHHYKPLDEDGSDSMDNMIVVCPNHHSQFDYKMIAIDLDGKNIINKNGTKTSGIYFEKNHKLNDANLLNQLRLK